MNCEKYYLITCIGEGAFGTVYQAINLRTKDVSTFFLLNRFFLTLFEFFRKLQSNMSKLIKRLVFLENMNWQADIHSELKHVNIVALKSFELHKNNLQLESELCEQGTLCDKLLRKKDV